MSCCFTEVRFDGICPASAAYDLVADAAGKLIRIQCKTSRAVPNGFEFNTYSAANGGPTRGYGGRADYFMTCFENRFYLIPVGDCTVGKKRLRLPDASNTRIVTSAKPYELPAAAARLFSESDNAGVV